MPLDSLDANLPTAMRRGVRTIVELLAGDPLRQSDRALLPLIAAAALTPVAAAESPRAVLAELLGAEAEALGEVLETTVEHLASENDEKPALAAIEAALVSYLDEALESDAAADLELRSELRRVFKAIEAEGVAAEAAGGEEFGTRLESEFERFAAAVAAHESQAVRSRLVADAAAWAARDRDPSYLYSGGRLEHVEHERWSVWQADPERFPPPGATALAFLDRSRGAQAKRARTRLAMVSGLACLLLLMSTVIVVVLVANHHVGEERDRAYSRELAEASLAAGGTDGDLARRLAATAWAFAPTSEAESALRQAATNNRTGVLASAPEDLQAVKFSPDGAYLVGVSETQYLVWDAATWELLDALPYEPLYTFDYDASFAFDGESRILALTTADGIAFWDLRERAPADLPTIAVAASGAIALSHDASLVAVATSDPDAVQIIEVGGGASPLVEQFPALVTAVGFDPTEPRLWVGLETWPGDGVDNLRFVNYEQGEVEAHSFSTHPTAFDISPAGDLVAVSLSGGYSTTAPLTEERESQILTDLVSPAVFPPDGHTVVGATPDGAVGVWDLESARKIGTLSLGNCVEIACPIAIAPDGKTVVQGVGAELIGFDTERVEWTYEAPEAWTDTGFDYFASGAIVPESGDLVAVNDNGVHRWRTGEDGWPVDRAAPEHLSELPGETLAVSPDGSVVAIGAPDTPNVTVIELDRPEEQHVLETGGYTAALAFDASGSRLAVAVGAELDTGEHSRVEFWDTGAWEREPIEPIDSGEYPAWALCISADGRTVYFGNGEAATAVEIATGDPVADLGAGAYDFVCGPDETIVGQSYQILWNWTADSGDGAIIAEAPMEDLSTGSILAVSPDGRYIATADWGGGAWLWEAETGLLLRTLGGYGSGHDLAFSAEGDALVSFGKQITVWDLAYLDDPNAAVCDQIDHGLTFEEWGEHVPDLEYGSALACAG